MLPKMQRVWGNEPSHSEVNSDCGSWSPNGLSNLQNTITGVKPIGLNSFLYHWPNFLVFKSRETYHWKALDEGYNFVLDFIVIRGLHAKLWAPKVAGVLAMGILGLPLTSPGTKGHLHVAPMESCREYYKGEGGGFPQVWVVVSLVSGKLPLVRPNTKSA